MFRARTLTVLFLAVTLLVASAFSQTVNLDPNKEKIKYIAPTHRGSGGLFNLYLADTLRQGEFSIGIFAHKFNRDPGDLDFTIFPISFSVGLHDRIELFASYEAYKRVNADWIMVGKVLPGAPLQPTHFKNGTVGYYNDTPFMDTGFGDGSGDLWAGIKFNLLSERRGQGISLAVQPIARFHTTSDRQHKLRGLTPGVTDAGIDLIMSKNLPGRATFAGNAGFLFADDIAGVDRQHRFNWGLGVDVPLGTLKASAIGELIGAVPYGSKRDAPAANVMAVIDAYAGLRVFPTKWMAVTGAANFHLRDAGGSNFQVEPADLMGFYASVGLLRKINEPPTVECAAERSTVTEGDSVRISATADDPDNSTLSLTWQTSGGSLSESDAAATLDTSGLAPGRYSVKAEVSDGEAVASCSVDINVEKRKMPPTIVCEPATTTVTAGSSATLNARASDPNGDALSYAWTVDGQAVTNNRPSFDFGTAGRAEGAHTVRVTATDVDGMSASCDFTVTIAPVPNTCPTVSLTLSKADAIAGETVNANAAATDKENDPLTYSWTVDNQARSETGTSIAINTTGMTGGSHTVSVTVRDPKNCAGTDTKTFKLTEKIVIPFDRLDNKAKARLDEIALKMQQNPQLRARVTGHTDDRGSEAANMRTGQRRADSVKDYLVKNGNVDASRIETRSAGEASPIADNKTADGRKQNRRVEVELYVP